MADAKPTLPQATGPQQPVSFQGASITPDFDVIELLPDGAPRDRLRALRVRRDDAYALTIRHAEMQSLTLERVEAEQRLQKLRAHPHAFGHNLPVTDTRVIAQQKGVDKLTADVKRLNARSEERSRSWQAAGRVVLAVETWLKGARPGTLEDAAVELPKLNKGETVPDAIERLRRRVRELRADLHRVQSSPFPSAHAKAQLRAQVDALAQRGAPTVALLIEHDREIVWPTVQLQASVHNVQGGAIAYATMPDALALTCWLHRDALIAALDREIAAEADDVAALSHEQRQTAKAEVEGDLLATERQECALTWMALDQKQPVEFRQDVSPLAVLGVAVVTAPRAPNGPTSPDHAYTVVQPYGGRR